MSQNFFQNKILVALISFGVSSNIIFSQEIKVSDAPFVYVKILDAPFIYEKEYVTNFLPREIFFELHSNPFIFKLTESDFFNLNKNDLSTITNYPNSYLYSEPEFARVRVIKLITFNENNYFTDVIEQLNWVKDKEIWKAYTDTLMKKSVQTISTNDVNISLPRVINQFVGINFIEINQDRNEYSHSKLMLNNFKFNIDEYISKQYIKVNDEGILTSLNSYPNYFQTISFKELIKKAIVNKEMYLFEDKKFSKYIKHDDILNVIDSYLNEMTAIKIMEDYYIHPITKKLTSTPIGIALVGKDTALDNELLWMYYPEFRYVLMEKAVIINEKIVGYETIFNKCLYNFEIEYYTRLAGYVNFNSDYDFSVKLDPLIKIKLHEELNHGINKNQKQIAFEANNGLNKLSVSYSNGLIEGDIIEYFSNDNISFKGTMKSGSCDGVFKFYYPSGKIKAIRNYISGQLQGEQLNYYENGNFYACYQTDSGYVTNLTRYYKTNELMEEGSFKMGIPIGKWTHNIKFKNEDIVSSIKQSKLFEKILMEDNYRENYIKVSLEYTQEDKEYCSGILFKGYYIPICNYFKKLK